MDRQIKLRVHHFYDIIRDFGSGKKIEPHPYGHSLHKIARLILSKPNLGIKIVVSCDSICVGCSHYKTGHCDDTVTQRKDFTLKEEFNDYIDRRIMDKCQIKEGSVLTPIQLCRKAKDYLDNINYIYLGNEDWHTKERKENVIKGVEHYLRLHNFTHNLKED
jgi:hypothetical protein